MDRKINNRKCKSAMKIYETNKKRSEERKIIDKNMRMIRDECKKTLCRQTHVVTNVK